MQIAETLIKKCLKNIIGVHPDMWTVTVNRMPREHCLAIKIHNKIDYKSARSSYKDLRFYVGYSVCCFSGKVTFHKVVLPCHFNREAKEILTDQIKSQLIGVDENE